MHKDPFVFIPLKEKKGSSVPSWRNLKQNEKEYAEFIVDRHKTPRCLGVV